MEKHNKFGWIQTRVGFVMILVLLVGLKTLLANIVDFNLFSAATPVQYITMIISPFGVPMLMIGSSLFFKKASYFYPIAIIMYTINIVLIQLNVIYWREFSQFMSVLVMLGYNKVNQGLGASGFALTKWHDILYWIDYIIIPILFITKILKVDKKETSKIKSFSVITLGILVIAITFVLGEAQRPQLITRQFDSKEMTKDLGLDTYTIIDAIKTHNVDQLRKDANRSSVKNIRKYMNKHYADINPQYAGIAKGKDVFIIHLESFQQFLIGLKINGKEVTPFLNKIYHSKNTIAFNNFFHQVGQGKTSDAETLMETSTFGLPQGSLFATDGSTQTFQAMPAILDQKLGYSSAVFHGNNASFWNRNNTYKRMGYQYFFDASYFDTTGNKSEGYGLKDKLLFKDSIKYLQRMQQPFYVKYLTVTNHFPYSLDKIDKNPNFKTTNTGNSVIDGYFETANYLDDSIKEFYSYLYKSGLAKHSIVVLYGDHYGLSNAENKTLAPIVGKNPNKWDSYNNAMMQRVPLMIDIPGYKKGFIDHTYGGEVDVMPTIEHLLGIKNTKKYMQFGQDLFSKKRNQVVVFRNRNIITPKYDYINKQIYNNKTGQLINDPSKKIIKIIENDQNKAYDQLNYSDELNEGDLLRFYTPKGFTPVKSKLYNYSNGMARLEKLEDIKGGNSTSLWSLNGNKTTTDLYYTNAPEKNEPRVNNARIEQVARDGGYDNFGKNNTPNP